MVWAVAKPGKAAAAAELEVEVRFRLPPDITDWVDEQADRMRMRRQPWLRQQIVRLYNTDQQKNGSPNVR